jgi:enoyl-[acyl-carrier protein] reductase II
MLTPLCRSLGIDVPIIQAPMNWATDARLVAAVSNAGGLGVLGPNAGDEPPSADPNAVGERLRRQIQAIRRMTTKPFAVNVPIGRGGNRIFSDRSIEVLIEERIRIAIIVTGSPEVYTERLKVAGVFVIHAVASVKHARKAESCRVDAVVAEGFDAGGHSGFDEMPTAALVPQVVQACTIPVIAAGGIVDGRGLVAALGYGAQAVYMGTRFMATVECPIHDKVKQAIVAAPDTGTTSWGRKTEIARTLKNRFTDSYRELELSGATREQLHHFIADYTKIAGGRRVAGLRGGDLDDGEVYVGAGAGLVRDIVTCAEVIDRTMKEARETLDRLDYILRAEPGTLASQSEAGARYAVQA